MGFTKKRRESGGEEPYAAKLSMNTGSNCLLIKSLGASLVQLNELNMSKQMLGSFYRSLLLLAYLFGNILSSTIWASQENEIGNEAYKNQ
jgi:hypothetical protein